MGVSGNESSLSIKPSIENYKKLIRNLREKNSEKLKIIRNDNNFKKGKDS